MTSTMWTTTKPDHDGWWWMREVVGSIAIERVVHVLVMSGDREPSVYFAGQWRDISKVGNDRRSRWSNRPIRKPNDPTT